MDYAILENAFTTHFFLYRLLLHAELDSVVLNLKRAIYQFVLCVLIRVDFIRCSYVTKFSAMYLKMDFYIVIISLLDC